MPAILDRGEGNAKRKERLAKLKKGPGVFVYDGSLCDTESIPTPLLVGKAQPVFDARGMPVVDKTGRQQYAPAGQFVRDESGQPVLGGTPKTVTRQLSTFKLRGFEFPAGKPVTVSDSALALKLRGMNGFEEVEAIQVETEPDAGEFEGLTRPELMKLASSKGLDVSTSDTKADLLAKLGVAAA